MAGYSLAGFLWAKWFFLRVQDHQWTGAVLSLPALFGAKAAPAAPSRKPWRALIRKEFQLHQINLLIGGLLLLGHLVVIIVRRTNAAYFGMHREEAMIWEAWPLVWLSMPLLIGAMAVAEERKLGTLEPFLCLPVTRRREFWVKFIVVMFLGVSLGGVMPLLVEWLGSLIGLNHRIFDTAMVFNGKFVTLAAEVLAFSAGLAFVALYASTLTRNLLQALGLAVVLSVFSSFVIEVAAGNGSFMRDQLALLWTGPLIGLVGWPVMVGTIIALAFKNFKQPNVGGKVWSRNALTVVAALVFTTGSTTVIYHRVWELWMRDEPVHRPWSEPVVFDLRSKTNGFTEKLFNACPLRAAAILADGELWLRQRKVLLNNLELEGQVREGYRTEGSWREGFVAGINWREVVASEGGCFATQSDGSLWDLSEVQPGTSGSEPKLFGGSHDWKKISGAGGHFTALKTDGTLWQWGYKRVLPTKQVSLERIAAPVQVGNDSDWTAICDSPRTTAAVKNDGSIWRFGRIHETGRKAGETADQIAERPEPWLSSSGQHPWFLSLNSSASAIAAVCRDGTLWVGGSYFFENYRMILPRESAARARREMVRLENTRYWKEVRFVGWESLVALNQSGALWSWTRRFSDGGEIMGAEMPSQYSKWVSASPFDNDSFLALASDGKICLWGKPQWNLGDFTDRLEKLLGPSRIKARTIAEIRR